ncbi:DNA-binding MarR family transcriptional regulator [Streptomyces sp. PanSC19]|uniref:MarR family winged helix-turn-helix transcriptional regulator n=1 Tax=Streptomyces sp. PanSC19 TaxID=1520455 RepID=UPI000F483315|nr:MarR family transcriptional regulator [Streptomyces sp. PanSC19]ROQ23201.1 DNA-binding MarR family transcriptional regulator [Streptomyces sp. PanSC19]
MGTGVSTVAAVGDLADGTTATEPRWLDAKEQEVWRAYRQAVDLFEDALDRQLQGDAGIPHLYYALLSRLSEAPRHRMRMTDLAVHANITRSRLSHAMTRMEKSGWIRRDTCPSDGRGQFAVLTDEGHGLVRRTAPGHVETVRRGLFDRFTPEQAARFGELCGLIAEGFRHEDDDLPWRR